MSTDFKACCAELYSSELARLALGDSFHPGGAKLTSRLAAALEVGPGQVVVDIASGLGTSALQVARETGCGVVGVELSEDNVRAAQRRGEGKVRFVQGDAESLPFENERFDGALCECSFCLFAEPDRAAAEITRVLRRGARLALSDVTADPARLPDELATPLARFACVASARPLEDLVRLLSGAGLDVESTERHDGALHGLIERIAGRLRPLGLDTFPLLSAARSAVQDGALGYGVVIARRP